MKNENGFLKYTFVIVSSALVLTGCKKKAEEILTSAEEPVVAAPTCSLSDQTWVMCDPYNGTSSRTTMTITGTQLLEFIEYFPNNDTCSGVPDNNYSYNFSGSVTFGNLGESTYMSGATDVQVISIGNNLGCGTSQPIYTWALVANDCSQFYSSSIGSSCNPNAIGTTPSANPFIRQ